MLVTGELQTRNYTDRQGVKRYVTEVSVDSIYFADSKQDASPQPLPLPCTVTFRECKSAGLTSATAT
ncbi:MAG: single-stranded DNA-binding protein [Clostridium sp.]|nr:single-stranded DNA-binding protein [Clostridium sp.]